MGAKTKTLLRAAAMALLLTSAGAMADIAEPETLPDTLALLAERLKAELPDAGLILNEEDISLRFYPDGLPENEGSDAPAPPPGGMTFYPDNLHHALRSAASDTERATILDNFIQSTLYAGTDADAPLDPGRLMPVLRVRGFGSDLGVDAPLSRPFAGAISLFLVEDLPSQLKYVVPSGLAPLELEEDAAFARARGNLLARGLEPRIEGDQIKMLVLDGNFESSMMLDIAFWQRLDQDMGTIGAIVAARDLVLFADIDDSAARKALVDLVRQHFPTLSYQVSDELLRFTGDGWELAN